MKVLAGIAVIALVVVAFAQGYAQITRGGRDLSARNASPEATQIARTPSGAINWQAELATDTDTDSDADGISNIAENVMGALIDSYTALSETDSYSQEDGEKIAEDIAASLKASVSYPVYSAGDLETDSDTSYERMLAYRGDLRTALEPLLKNPGYELSIFANYIESRDQTYLDQLHLTIQNYRAAIESAANVVVPADALTEHIGILNSLSEFAAVVERLARHADDPFASAALLRTYNETELRLFASFDALATYEKNKRS